MAPQAPRAPQGQQASRPNILIVIPDELRADALSYAGHPVFRTPHIDRIAREGVWFRDAYCSAPLCMPARASMLTGTYPHNHHIQENAGSLPPDDESYALLLRAAGYATAYVGKTHFGSDAPGRDFVAHETQVQQRGFDYVHQVPGPMALTRTTNHLTRRWEELGLLERYREDYRRRAADPGAGAWASPLPAEEFADTYVGGKAEEWLRAYQEPRPFLLVVGFGGPHPPFDAPEPYASRYRPESLPAPIPAGELGDWLPEHVRRYMERLTGGDRRGESTPGAPVQGEEAVRISQQRMANYGGKIALIDDQVGRLLDIVDERGWTENTLVIFLSDHGEMGGDHGRYHKSVFFESSVRIPLAMRWPGGGLGAGPERRSRGETDAPGSSAARGRGAGLSGGRRLDALVEQLDLFATVVDAGGAAPSRRAFARSLLPLARGVQGAGEGERPREAVYSELKREIMVRDGRYKYVVDAEGRGVQLYHLEADPTEQRNLIGYPEHRQVERDLRERLLTWLVSTQVTNRDR
jgi:arylsulfatase